MMMLVGLIAVIFAGFAAADPEDGRRLRSDFNLDPLVLENKEGRLCEVDIDQGKVIGEYFAPFPTCAYKGIPYAQAPVNELRFAAPRPALKFPNGEFLATEFGPGCIQHCSLQHPVFTCPKTTSEDCLSINVWSPLLKSDGNELLPVFVFMHGGNYIGGSGGVDLYDGARWAVTQNVVIVTMNYRLGALGGLFVKHIRGNFQLQDQRLALKWVQENIHRFGGNRDAVTIHGQSAGGFSVASHLASPKSWPYFQRAIVISDPISLPEETTSKSQQLGQIFLKELECDFMSETKIDECLRSASAEKLLEVQQKVHFPKMPGELLHLFMPWTPVLTPEELPLSPMQAAEQGKLAPVPIMIGTVANESVQFIWEASPKPMDLSTYELYVDAIFGPIHAQSIFKLYGKPPQEMIDAKDVRLHLANIGTDYIFSCGVQKFARDAAKSNNQVYVYYFSHLPSFNDYLQGDWIPECKSWVCHGVDLPILFNTVYLLRDEPDHPYPSFEEHLLSNQLQTVWTNFARSGDPNYPDPVPGQLGETKPLHFPTAGEQPHSVFEVGVPSRVHENFKMDKCELFDKLGYEKN